MNGTLFQLHNDPRETPIYDVTEAAAYVGVARGTLRHWLKRPKSGLPIIEAADTVRGKLSFYNLLEAHVLRSTMERGIPLGNVRRAVEHLKATLPNSPHPLLDETFYTAKRYRSVFAKDITTGAIENLTFGGQYEFRTFLEKFLRGIERDASGPIRLTPFRMRHIVIDHQVSGGRPVVKGTGILAAILATRNRGGESAESLARDYGLELADVKEAIRYAA